MKKHSVIRLLALLLSLSALLTALSACSDKTGEMVSINEEALDYFNRAVSAFNVSKCLSICRATAVISNDEDPPSSLGYVLYFENFYDNNGATSLCRTVSKHAYADDPKTFSVADMSPLSTSYTKDGWVYYEEAGGKKYKVALENDYSNGIGLYSLGNTTPGGQYGIIDDGVVRVDLYFSAGQCKKSQQIFIENANAALLQGVTADVTYSSMTVSSFIDEKTGRFTSYEITFTGKCVVNGRNITLRYSYAENFFKCDADSKILFPADLSSYETLKN